MFWAFFQLIVEETNTHHPPPGYGCDVLIRHEALVIFVAYMSENYLLAYTLHEFSWKNSYNDKFSDAYSKSMFWLFEDFVGFGYHDLRAWGVKETILSWSRYSLVIIGLKFGSIGTLSHFFFENWYQMIESTFKSSQRHILTETKFKHPVFLKIDNRLFSFLCNGTKFTICLKC